MRGKMDNDRRIDKNVYVEPTIWTIEWVQRYYKYPPTIELINLLR